TPRHAPLRTLRYPRTLSAQPRYPRRGAAMSLKKGFRIQDSGDSERQLRATASAPGSAGGFFSTELRTLKTPGRAGGYTPELTNNFFPCPLSPVSHTLIAGTAISRRKGPQRCP